MQSPCPVATAFQKIIERDLQFSSVQLLSRVRLWILLWRYSAVRSGQMRMECSKEGAFRKSLSLDLLSSPLSDSSSFPFLPPPPPSSSFPFPLPHLPLLPPLTSLPFFFSHFSLLFFSPLPWLSSAPSPGKKNVLEVQESEFGNWEVTQVIQVDGSQGWGGKCSWRKRTFC